MDKSKFVCVCLGEIERERELETKVLEFGCVQGVRERESKKERERESRERMIKMESE